MKWMDGLSFDQICVFLSIVEHGSFSAAARSLNRAQSAVTYSIRKLEDQIGAALFDRSEYRPVLTEAGRALLPRARRIGEEVGLFRNQARGIAGGLEPELSLIVDPMFPTDFLVESLKAFQQRYPTVQTRIFVESLGGPARQVMDGGCALAILCAFVGDIAALKQFPLLEIELVLVAAPDHPLAKASAPLPPELLRDHIQLVLTDPSGLTGKKDYGVLATQTWRLADLGAKHALLKEGLGYGSMPAHMVREDLAAGRLVRLVLDGREGGARTASLAMCAAHRADRPIGPATQWMLDRLVRSPLPRSCREAARLSEEPSR